MVVDRGGALVVAEDVGAHESADELGNARVPLEPPLHLPQRHSLAGNLHPNARVSRGRCLSAVVDAAGATPGWAAEDVFCLERTPSNAESTE